MEYDLDNQIRMLNTNFLVHVFPYQSLTKSITLQQQQITLLQSRLSALLTSPEPTPTQFALLESYYANQRQTTLIHTKQYLQQCIKAEKQRFDLEYPLVLHNLNEQIESKSLTLDTDLDNMNVLCSLESDWEIVGYVIENVKKDKLEKMIGIARTYDEMQPGKIGNIVEAIERKKNE